MVLPEGILDWLFSITIAMTITAIFALTATLWFMLNRPSAQYYGWIGIAIASTGISLLATIGIAIYAAPVAADVPELMVGAAAFYIAIEVFLIMGVARDEPSLRRYTYPALPPLAFVAVSIVIYVLLDMRT